MYMCERNMQKCHRCNGILCNFLRLKCSFMEAICFPYHISSCAVFSTCRVFRQFFSCHVLSDTIHNNPKYQFGQVGTMAYPYSARIPLTSQDWLLIFVLEPSRSSFNAFTAFPYTSLMLFYLIVHVIIFQLKRFFYINQEH